MEHSVLSIVCFCYFQLCETDMSSVSEFCVVTVAVTETDMSSVSEFYVVTITVAGTVSCLLRCSSVVQVNRRWRQKPLTPRYDSCFELF